MTNREEEKIIKLLENLPQHKDDRPQKEIYEKLALQLEGKPQRKNRRFIPYVAVAVIFLLFLSLPFLVNNITEQTTMEMNATDESVSQEMNRESSHDSASNSEEVQPAEQYEQSEITPAGSDVLTDPPSDQEVIHFATYDEAGKYIIPLTFLIPEEANFESYYGQIGEILNDYGLAPDNYILEDAAFSIDLGAKQVVLTIQSRLLEASETNDLLPQLLSEMFLPYGIEKATLVNEASGTTQTIDLSMYAEQQESYLLYDGNYIIVPQDKSSTVEEALHALKQSHSDIHIKPAMDATIEFTVEEAEEAVTVEFVEDSIQKADVTIQMIEAILLTAKSYGFKEVQFDHLPIDQLEDYDFTARIPVPTAVNLIAEIE